MFDTKARHYRGTKTLPTEDGPDTVLEIDQWYHDSPEPGWLFRRRVAIIGEEVLENTTFTDDPEKIRELIESQNGEDLPLSYVGAFRVPGFMGGHIAAGNTISTLEGQLQYAQAELDSVTARLIERDLPAHPQWYVDGPHES